MGWFRRGKGREDPFEGLEDDDLAFGGTPFDADEIMRDRGAKERKALREVCAAIDIINSHIDTLPKGMYLWMQWERPRRLLLTRRSPIQVETLHGDGQHRLFDVYE